MLPCFDEEDNVAAAVTAASRAAARVAASYEIVVVDDGSRDRTAAIAAALASTDRHVRLLRHPRNRGYGAAVRTGLAAARMPWLFLTDADLQFDLDELERFVAPARTADLVAGWRIARSDPLTRRANAAAWNWLVHRVAGVEIRDVDCAFKLIRRDLLSELRLTSDGATISAELVAKALAAGARIEQLGVHHRPRTAGRQSGARPRVIARALRELATLRRALDEPIRPALPRVGSRSPTRLTPRCERLLGRCDGREADAAADSDAEIRQDAELAAGDRDHRRTNAAELCVKPLRRAVLSSARIAFSSASTCCSKWLSTGVRPAIWNSSRASVSKIAASRSIVSSDGGPYSPVSNRERWPPLIGIAAATSFCVILRSRRSERIRSPNARARSAWDLGRLDGIRSLLQDTGTMSLMHYTKHGRLRVPASMMTSRRTSGRTMSNPQKGATS